MIINIWPPENGQQPDFVIDSSWMKVKARKGLTKKAYLQDVNLVCESIDYGSMLDCVVAAISIAEDELGKTPMSSLIIRWSGAWPVSFMGQSSALYVYQRGINGELQSDDSPEGYRIKYSQGQWKPTTYFKVEYEEQTQDSTNTPPHVETPKNDPLLSIEDSKAWGFWIETKTGEIIKFKVR